MFVQIQFQTSTTTKTTKKILAPCMQTKTEINGMEFVVFFYFMWMTESYMLVCTHKWIGLFKTEIVLNRIFEKLKLNRQRKNQKSLKKWWNWTAMFGTETTIVNNKHLYIQKVYTNSNLKLMDKI